MRTLPSQPQSVLLAAFLFASGRSLGGKLSPLDERLSPYAQRANSHAAVKLTTALNEDSIWTNNITLSAKVNGPANGMPPMATAVIRYSAIPYDGPGNTRAAELSDQRSSTAMVIAEM